MQRLTILNRLVIGAVAVTAALMFATAVKKPDDALALSLPATDKPGFLTENFLYLMGLAHAAMGNFEEARSLFARIRESDPDSSLGYRPVGMTYAAEGQLGQALYWMLRGHSIDREDLATGAWIIHLYDSLEDYEAAGDWSRWLAERVTNQPMAMAAQASHHYLSGNFELALQYSNLALRFDLPDRLNSDAVFMRIKRDEALGAGDPGPAIRLFESRHPGLFRSQVEITTENIQQATDLALLLKIAGRPEDAEHLLAAVLAAFDQVSVATWLILTGSAPIKAEALAILDDTAGSLAELRRVIDLGWRLNWRWKTDLNPNFTSVRQSLEFRTLVAELEADMAQQSAQVPRHNRSDL